ncbi:hypothetical protein [Micrococcus luteus]|uniref:hypothetical protein n=1 Tax=Micrococcus luteus TaxID=1270 RepID=UPI0036ADE0F7
MANAVGRHITVLDVFEDALGVTPAGVASRGRALTAADLALVMGSRHAAEESPTYSAASTEIWPLLSHHTYDNRSLFGGYGQDLVPRTLALLLLHDGLVVADPLETVQQVLRGHSESEAVRLLNQAVGELAQVEPLIAGGLLRLTALRPSLHDANRVAVLDAMGLSADLRVFTDFLEAAGVVPEIPGLLENEYAPQVRELYLSFGMNIPPPSTIDDAEARVRELAAAVIEVSWQFSVAALDSSCDLAFRGPVERHLAQALVTQGLTGDLGAGRHLSALELGRVPNIDTSRLTLGDAIAIRREDSFEAFRQAVRIGLDQLEVAQKAGASEHSSTAAFEETMRQEARLLRETAKRATFRDRVKEGSFPAALGVVSELLLAPHGTLYAAGAAGGTALTTLLWQWLLGRNKGQTVSQRYFSMLGGERATSR